MKLNYRLITRILPILFVLFFSAASALSSPTIFSEIKSLTQKGDYAGAFVLYKKFARQGTPQAQYGLAVLYYSGRGVELDLQKAAVWFKKAADQGMREAQYNYANMLRTGKGIKASIPDALFWWKKAADQGLVLAQLNLAVYYSNQHSDEAKYISYAWLRRATALHSQVAQRKLALRDQPYQLNTSRYPKDTVLIASEADVRTYSDDHYVLQFAAVQDLSAALDFVAKYGLGKHARVIRQENKDSTIIKIIYGDYPTMDDAKSTVRSMRSELKSLKPWARPIKDIWQQMGS